MAETSKKNLCRKHRNGNSWSVFLEQCYHTVSLLSFPFRKEILLVLERKRSLRRSEIFDEFYVYQSSLGAALFSP